MRLPLDILLALLLVICGLSLVTSQHRARNLFIESERAQEAVRKLEVEWNELLLEQTQYARHSRIEEAARRELNMQPATPARTEYVTLQPLGGGSAKGGP